ncbi:uncharacterized protein ELE39_000792 [Cryptosporidium sp. chipmunk genotype I]|uniref:uncharacterized protein n=1 Tax=Cryptosporidium sp. chipmunk genotype I TaxID=1280935 RepID=UPI003519ECBC|nr:hypothetical protein ELE39_000792 [Cryptosporidium sp. chipmunk genotype I]
MASTEVYREAIRTVIEYVSTKYGPEEENVINMILESKGIPGIFRGQPIHSVENMMVGRGHGIILEKSMDYDLRISSTDANNNNCNVGLNIISGMIQPTIHQQIQPTIQQQIQPIIHHPVIQHQISPEIRSLIQSPIMAQSFMQQQQTMHSLTAGTATSSSTTINTNTNTISASTFSPSHLEQPSSTVVTTTHNFHTENSGDERATSASTVSAPVAVTNTTCNSPLHSSSSYSYSASSAEPSISSNANPIISTTTTTTTTTTTSTTTNTNTTDSILNNDNNTNSIRINSENEKYDGKSNLMNIQNNATESTTHNSGFLNPLKENSNSNTEIQVNDEKTIQQINNIRRDENEKEDDIEDISEKIRTMLRMATDVNELNQAIKMAYSAGLTYEAGLGERKLKKLLC